MRVGILGFGYMGTIRHRELAVRADGDVRRIFHTAPLPEPLAGLQANSWEEVVDDPLLDAVFVCLPNHLTLPAVERALSAGKHVFAEKPPGRTLAEAERMATAAGQAARVLQFGFNHRQHPAFRALQEHLSDRGPVAWLRGVYGKAREPDFEQGWRADPAQAGGGILLDQGIHMLDLMRALMGPVREVQAVAVGTPLPSEVMVTLVDDCGAVASLHSSQSQWPPRFSLDVGLADGVVSMEGLLSRSGRYGPETLRWRDGDTGEEGERVFTVDDSWAREIDAFMRAARGDGAVEVGSTSEALEVMRLVSRIHDRAGISHGLH